MMKPIIFEKILCSIWKQRGGNFGQCLFHTFPVCHKKGQIANAFIKLNARFEGKKSLNGKPTFTQNVAQPNVKSIVQDKKRRFVRRENALNKMFMSHITDFMSSSEISQSLVGKGIEISKVKINSDFRILFVFWLAKEDQDDRQLQELLDGFASPLRDQLSQLRVVGNVPNISFVKDKFKSKLSDINSLLSKADYGEDFQPVYPSLLKMDNIRISDPDSLQDLAMGDLNEMPPMTHNVFRIDHMKIMNEISKAVHKSKALHRKGGDPGMPLVLGDEDIKYVKEPDTNAEPPLTYAEYLKSQKILRSKQRKEKLVELIQLEGELTERLAKIEIDDEDDEYLDEDSDDDLGSEEYRR